VLHNTADVYRCPAGGTLCLTGARAQDVTGKRRIRYASAGAVCTTVMLDGVDIQRVQMNALMMDSKDMNALGVCS
jgi:hypothetical protein